MSGKRVSVVVLGDVGRSPRMQYHSLSFAKEGYDVDIIGYGGSDPFENVTKTENIMIHKLKDCPDFQRYFPRLLSYIFKVLWQIITLAFGLVSKKRSDHIIVQNPPAIPTLAVCWLYSAVYRSNFIIDWHNYGYTILSLTLGEKHMLVRVSETFEKFFGQRAEKNICVSKAMRDDLAKKWGIRAVTLYDRPPEHFKSVTVKESHLLFSKLSKTFPSLGSPKNDNTIFTCLLPDGSAHLLEDRPGVLVSSTSWTEDEDFGMLLSALKDYEDAKQDAPSSLPSLVCFITGKGPLKEYYSQLISDLKLEYVKIITPWLQPEDYPVLLASCDLGVCLHTSSSGLDLPMKVVDMFGCGLPVCAVNFKCLKELVQHEVNGFVFEDADHLSRLIRFWFKGFPSSDAYMQKNKKFREEISKFQKLRWEDNWTRIALPLFK